MEDDEGYMVLNLQPKRGNATRPSPGGSQESPQSPRWHGVVLKVGCTGIVILLVMVAVLSVWVFQGFSNKAEDGLALRNDDFTQQPGSGRECNASVENLFSCLRQSLCDPVQINPAGSSRCKLCPTEWMPHGDKCYWVSKESNTWNKSHDDCSKKGSQMLVIQHREQMDYLQPFMPDDNPVWIGLTFNSSERKCIWVDGSHLNGECREGWSPSEEDPEREPDPPWMIEPSPRGSPDRKQVGGSRPLKAPVAPPDRKQGDGARSLRARPVNSVRGRRPKGKDVSPPKLLPKAGPGSRTERERPALTPVWGSAEASPQYPIAWELEEGPAEGPMAWEPEEDPSGPPADYKPEENSPETPVVWEPEADPPEQYRAWDPENLPALPETWGPQDLEELPSEDEPMELPELPPVDEEGLVGLPRSDDPEEVPRIKSG